VKELPIKVKLSENCNLLIIEDDLYLRPFLEKFLGKDLVAVLSVFYNKRSNKQNRYLFGVIIPCVIAWALETMGETWTKEKARVYIYTEVLGYEIDSMETSSGKVIFWFEGKRFSQMNTVEFNDAKTTCQFYFAQRGKIIPDPRGDNLLNDFVK